MIGKTSGSILDPFIITGIGVIALCAAVIVALKGG
jgi:hypothetical protein